MSTSLYGGIIKIGKDGQPIQPELVLANRRGQKLGVINNVESLVISNHLMEACEISFDIHKIVDGEECQFWDKIKDFKFIYIPDLTSHTFNPWYELSVEVDEQDSTVKHCEGVHAQEAELSQLTLNGVEINTEDDIDRDDYVITKIYDPDNADGSLLDRILHDKASHYSIYHVDDSIAKMQRTFSWDGDTIKDAFDDIADEVECIFVYGEHSEDDGKIHRTISVYDLNDVCMDCGERGSFENGVCTKCGSKNIKNGYGENSGIFLNHENFASSITYSSNKDEVKNCFRLVAGDDLMTATIRNINPNNSQYIWYLSDELRADMSSELQTKLAAYDADYAEYESTKKMDIPEDSVDAYNTLVDRYIGFDDTLVKFGYPIVGYSTMTDLYYEAMNLYTLLQTTLAPASEIGTVTTAAEQIKHLTAGTLSPLGIQDASKASAATVTSMLKSYAKTFYDTSLYSISLDNTSYSNKLWTGTITLTSYSDEDDTATTNTLSITVTDATADYLKTQIEKVMKKNETDATGTVNLFSKSESEFKKFLTYYSVDNLEMLSQICRGCMDVLIEQGCADSSHSLYSSMYIPYYNKYQWIEEELNVRESEVKVLVTDDDDDSTGLLNYIEKLRNKIAKNLDLQTYLGDELWTEFCSFRRDDEYQNDNFISDGLADDQLIAQAKEFLKRANSEIKKSATLQHTISCNLNNLLLVERNDSLYDTSVTIDGNTYSVKTDDVMSPLLEKFDVGSWIYLEVDGNLYKLRLTDYTIDFDGLDTIDVEFSDVVYSIGSMSDIQSVLSKAQSMSTSYSYVQRQASDGSNANSQIANMASNGLSLANTKIVNSADNQNLVYDDTGMIMRKLNDFGAYNDEQVKIINSGLYFTKDNWETVETGVGKFIYHDPETNQDIEDYGVIANKIVGKIILGNEVGIYNASGSIKMNENGFSVTAASNSTNTNLFTLQKENSDGSYTKYIYVNDNGDMVIDGGNVQLNGASLSSCIDDIYVELSDASKVATNYLKYDSSGLCVGSIINGYASGGNTLITTTGMQIRQGTTVLADYSANNITLGANSKTTSIDLCNGMGAISGVYVEDDDEPYYYLDIASKNQVIISSKEGANESAVNLASGSLSLEANSYTSSTSYDVNSRSYIEMDNDGSMHLTSFDSSYTSTITVNASTISLSSGKRYQTNYLGWTSDSVASFNSGSSMTISSGSSMTITASNDNIFIGGVSIGTIKPYYKPGDTMNITGWYTGTLTGSYLKVHFTVPMCKPTIGVNKVSPSAIYVTLRQGSNYIWGTDSVGKKITDGISVSKTASGLNITLTISKQSEAINNETISIRVVSGTVTFSA